MCSDANTVKVEKQKEKKVMFSRKLRLIMMCHHNVFAPLHHIKFLFESNLVFVCFQLHCYVLCAQQQTLPIFLIG